MFVDKIDRTGSVKANPCSLRKGAPLVKDFAEEGNLRYAVLMTDPWSLHVAVGSGYLRGDRRSRTYLLIFMSEWGGIPSTLA